MVPVVADGHPDSWWPPGLYSVLQCTKYRNWKCILCVENAVCSSSLSPRHNEYFNIEIAFLSILNICNARSFWGLLGSAFLWGDRQTTNGCKNWYCIPIKIYNIYLIRKAVRASNVFTSATWVRWTLHTAVWNDEDALPAAFWNNEKKQFLIRMRLSVSMLEHTEVQLDLTYQHHHLCPSSSF